VDQYLYRLFGADGNLLYTGVSDDWTRRLRQHWLGKQWSAEILGVTLETYPDRLAVLAAERKAIRAEGPLYNVQHNQHLPIPGEPDGTISGADILLIAALVIAAGLMIYQVSKVAIERYRVWKADREEFREWRRSRSPEEKEFSQEDDPRVDITSPVVATQPTIDALDNRIGVAALMAFYANMHNSADGSPPKPYWGFGTG
jgi:predicted GIY-YIG superfamily endonuclease